MQIFGWMQNKLNGNKKHDTNLVKNHRRQESCKEEFSDWPNGLLAIGTFGNDEIKDSNQKHVEENISSQELSLEEIKKLQNELDALLHKEVQSTCDSTKLDIDILISEEKRSSSNECYQDHKSIDNDRHLEPSSSIVLSRGRDLCLDNTSNSAINRKSLSFILKQMFVCRKGLTPAPSLRDQVPGSRMEKILRAILHKKVYPQSTNPSLSMKKYLENNNYKPKSAKEDDTNDPQKADNGSKWVKTDSEYIVLEI